MSEQKLEFFKETLREYDYKPMINGAKLFIEIVTGENALERLAKEYYGGDNEKLDLEEEKSAIPLYKIEIELLERLGLEGFYQLYDQLGSVDKAKEWVHEEVIRIYRERRPKEPETKIPVCKRCHKPLNHLQVKRGEKFCSYLCQKKYTLGE